MAKARRVAAPRGKPAKTKKPTQKEIFEECLRSAQDLVDKIIADTDLGLVQAEADVVAKIKETFESQSEIAGDGNPARLTDDLKKLLTPLVRAGRSVDICSEGISLKALYWKGFIAKAAKDTLKQLKCSKGLRGFLDWVGWKKSATHMWINLYREFGEHLLKMPPGISQNKLEEIYKALGMQSLDWTSKHLEEIAQAPNVEAVQKLLGTYKEKASRQPRSKATSELQPDRASGTLEQIVIGRYTAGFQEREDGHVTAFVDALTVEDKNGLVQWLQTGTANPENSTAVDSSHDAEEPETTQVHQPAEHHQTLDVFQVEEAKEPEKSADHVPDPLGIEQVTTATGGSDVPHEEASLAGSDGDRAGEVETPPSGEEDEVTEQTAFEQGLREAYQLVLPVDDTSVAIPVLRTALTRSDFDERLLAMESRGLVTLMKPENPLALSDAESVACPNASDGGFYHRIIVHADSGQVPAVNS